MKLLMTVDAVGGVWTYAADLAQALRPMGIEPVLAVLGPASSDVQRAAATGVRVIDTGLPLDWLAPDEATVRHAGATIAALAAREGADLIQLNQPALAAAPMPEPVIAALHSCVATWWQAVEQGPLPCDFRWQTSLVRAGLTRADAIVCPSDAFAGAARQAYALPLAPRVVHNGRRPLPTSTQPLAQSVFTAGRLWDRGKNVATLDRAAALLRVPLEAAGPLAGPNGDRVELCHARALGTLDEASLAAQLARRPVFASAATYEPFGLAVLEAAQAGCALVLADTPTFRELWGDAAVFVPAHDHGAFAAVSEALLDDPAGRDAAGEAARTRAARYTVAAMATGMAALYRETLQRRAAA